MEVDTEMQDAGNLSDADSLASTAPSEQASEYDVEEILSERISEESGKKEFLLKWAEYPIHRATWESAAMFVKMDDALLKWNEKKRKIKAGLEQPFDVDGWERAMTKRKRETRRRKQARRQKRAERAARKNGGPLPQPTSQAQPSSRESSPDVPLMQASRQSSPDVPLIRTSTSRGSTSRKSHHRSASTGSDISSLFVSADDPDPKVALSKGNSSTSTPATAQPLQDLSPSGPTRVQLEPTNPSQSQTIVSGTTGGPLPQPSQAVVNASEESQPAQPPQPQTSPSLESSQPSQLLPEVSKTAISKPDKVSDKEPSQNTGQKPATGTEPPQKPQPQRSHASSGQTAKHPALGPLYTAFAFNKISHREPDVSQLNLRKPSEFPARKAAGVPVPFATMTAADKFRRTSQSGMKATTTTTTATSSVSQVTASSGAPRTGSSETMEPPPRAPRAPQAERPERARPLSPRGPPLSFGRGSFRPGDSRRSPPALRPDPRDRSPDFHRRSPGVRSRSPDRWPRSPERRRSPPASRRRSPEHCRASDCYRPTTSSPFLTAMRPKSHPPVPITSTRSSPPAHASPPATVTNTENNKHSVSDDSLALSTNPPSPPHEPPMSVKDKINRMPIGVPGRGTKFFAGHYFVNPGEVLAHVYFGTDRHFVGVVRLCGLSSEAKSDLLAAKGRSSKFEMWFQYVCTKSQYETLCRAEEAAGGSNRVVRTCWMEGFADTNPEIFHMSEELEVNNQVGIYYPPGLNGYVWLAYSPKSPDFSSLTLPYPDISLWVPIRLAVRTPLAPIEALKNSALEQPRGPQHTQSPTMAMVPYDPSNPSITGVSDPLDDVVRRLTQNSGPSNLNRPVQAQGSYGSPIQSPMEQRSPVLPLHGELARKSQVARPTAPNLSANFPADPRLRRLTAMEPSTQQPSYGQSRPVGDGSGNSTIERLNDVTVGLPSDPMDTAPDNTRPTHATLISASQNQGLPDGNSMLREFFELKVKMKFKDLANVNGKHDGPQADMFYLHTPDGEEGQNDCTVLKAWLEMNGAMIWSDWAKFVKNSKCGVVLFHETFRRYDVLRPNLKDALGDPHMGFWTFRITRPLDYPDLRYCQQGVHFQRIFSRGGAYLLTEDVLKDLKEALVIVWWFNGIVKSNPGQWKLVCWPNLLKSLEEKLEHPDLSKDDQQLLVALIWQIRKCNSFDTQWPFFEPESLNSAKLDGPNNNILSLTVAGYGERSEQTSPNLPRDLTQTERNADHLAESFAGWAIENAARLRRFYIITNCKNEALLKRWTGWGHVILFSVQSFLEKYKHKMNVKDVVEKLQSKSKHSKPSSDRPSHSGPSSDRATIDLSSPIQTPQTPMATGVPTPRDPNADHSNRPRPTEWRPPQPQENHRYAAPYR